jgi:hypothetical protein
MSAPRVPREPAPSVAVVLLTLIVALAACFGTLVVGIRVVDWWRGSGL